MSEEFTAIEAPFGFGFAQYQDAVRDAKSFIRYGATAVAVLRWDGTDVTLVHVEKQPVEEAK